MITRVISCPFERIGVAYHGGAKLKISYAGTNIVSKQFAAIVVSFLSYQLSERAD